MNKDLERKLKRERVEVCLNCNRFVKCDDIGEFEECADFEEVEDEAWVIRKLEEFDLVVCPNCDLMYSSFLIDNCPRCGWNFQKHGF